MRVGWILAPVAGAAALVGALAWSAPEQRNSGDIYRQLELFADVLARVEQDYVVEIDEQQAMEAAIQGMLASLDPHSSYMNAEDYREMQSQTRGEYGGLGIEVTSEDGVVKVVSPIDGTPAARAGIQAGDYLTAINGESIVGLTLNEAVTRMRGEAGTEIIVTIAREGTDPFDVTLRRETINVRAVTARVEGGDIGIIRVSTFNERTGPMLQDAIRTVKRDTAAACAASCSTCATIRAACSIKRSKCRTRSLMAAKWSPRAAVSRKTFSATMPAAATILAGVPVVVLINGASASAAEIVAGALQDRNRALIVGTDSFGKGSVQTVIPLQGGRDGALRLTTARYYTPAGRSIQGRASCRTWKSPHAASTRLRLSACNASRCRKKICRTRSTMRTALTAAPHTFRTINRRKTGTPKRITSCACDGIPAPRHGCGTTPRPRRLRRFTSRKSI
jgi:carboxyl-terminal processing protease